MSHPVRLERTPVHPWLRLSRPWVRPYTPRSFPTARELDPADLARLVTAGLLVPVRRTRDGSVTEYRLSHALRVLLGREDS